MVTTVDKTVLYNWNFSNRVELKCAHQEKKKEKKINMWGDRCVNSVEVSIYNV